MGEEKLYIKRAGTEEEYQKSAILLTENDPWKTLGRTYDYSMGKVRDSSGELYVVYFDGRIAGCVLLEMNGTLRGFIRALCMDKTVRGKGIGSRVLAYMENLIFESYPNVFLFADSFNEDAIRFYRRQGYEQVGLMKDYAVKGVDEIIFRKTLGPSGEFQKTYPAARI